MLEYRIDPGQRLIVIGGSGRLDPTEIIAHHRRVREDPAFRPEFDQLIDLRAATDASDVWADIPRYAWGRSVTGIRRAFVAPQPRGLVYGVARQNAAYAEMEGVQARVFDSLADAEEWLGLPPGGSGLSPDPHQPDP